MNITGKTKIYKGKYGYSCSISNKNQDGSYSNMFMQIQLPKGIEPEDKSIIEITKGFISFYENSYHCSTNTLFIQPQETNHKNK